jgi:pimeloyl-ACP methyl ester carboxylesterase
MQSAEAALRPAKQEPHEHEWSHRHIDVGEVRLHVVEAGPEDGELVVLLHGFPEFWWSWRFQIPKLAAAGFRVAAPDMRGYNLSDKPYGVEAYRVEHLVRDVAGLVKALGRERAHIVGHDWGGAVAWDFAQRHPELTKTLTVMNCPHPRELLKGLRRPLQIKKSWYMFFFQLPGLPERALMKDDASFLRRAFKGHPKQDVDRYVEAAKRARSMNGPINYYRAAMRGLARGAAPQYRPIVAPVLVLWGEADAFLGVEMARPDPRWVPELRVELVPGASHWVQMDAPDTVNRAMIEHLRRAR